jgi:hypothetical protein
VVNNATSSSKKVNCGVPKGSNLGKSCPILFFIYINDFSNCLENSHAAMHADDTNITAGSSSLCNVDESLNNELESIHQWLLSNK